MKNLKLSVVVLLLLLSAGLLFAEGLTAKDMMAAAKAEITEITVAQAKGLHGQSGIMFIDVREPNETAMGIIPGSITVPRGLLEFQIAGKQADQHAKIVVYCKSGGRSSLATQTLLTMGYTNAVSMAGGWGAWEKAGYPVE